MSIPQAPIAWVFLVVAGLHDSDPPVVITSFPAASTCWRACWRWKRASHLCQCLTENELREALDSPGSLPENQARSLPALQHPGPRTRPPATVRVGRGFLFPQATP